MDSSTLLKIARLRTLAARHGKPFDVVRFASDRAFAKATLTAMLDTGNEDLLVAGLELMNAMKMVAEPAASPAPAAVQVAPAPAPEVPALPDKPVADKYIGRLR